MRLWEKKMMFLGVQTTTGKLVWLTHLYENDKRSIVKSIPILNKKVTSSNIGVMDNRPSQIRIYIFIPNRWCFWLGNIFLFSLKWMFVNIDLLNRRFSVTCFRQPPMMENKSNRVRTTDAFSGELPAYLSFNCLFNGTLSYSWCYFVRIRPISQ